MAARTTLAFLAVVLLVNFSLAFRLTILHTAEVRSNILPVDKFDTPCSLADYQNPNKTIKCLGGYARRAALINEIKANETNVLVLDAGNYFQGTLFFYRFNGKLDMDLMSDLGYNFVGLGNREFDAGITNLAANIDSSGLQVLSCNLNVTGESRLRTRVKPYAVMTFGSDKVGIVGFTSPDLFELGSPGPTVSLLPSQTSITAAVANLQENEGVDKIILMSSWTREDAALELISTIPGIDIVVTNHANLYSSDDSSATKPSPYEVTGPTGRPIYVLSPGVYGKWLGQFTAEFDGLGVVANYTGQPIKVSAENVPNPDAAVDASVVAANSEIEVYKTEVIGSSLYFMNGSEVLCRFEECTVGNMITDAIRQAGRANIGWFNAGGILSSINQGNVTLSDLIAVSPFQNTIATFSIRGSDIPAVLINSVSRADNRSTTSGKGRFLQVSGMRFSWNPTLDVGSRVLSVEVLNEASGQYEALRANEVYTIATINYLTTGTNDGYTMIPGAAVGLSLYGPSIDGVLINYIRQNSPLNYPAVEGRILITDREGAVFERQLVVVPEAMKQAFLVVTVVLCAIPVFFFCFLLIHRLHAAVVTASLLFCFVILGAAVLGYGGLIAFIVGVNDAACMVFPWLTSSAFVIMYGALFSKTYRIYQIFRRTQKIRRKNVTNGLLLAIVGGIWGIEIILLIVWTVVSPLRWARYADPNPNLLIDYETCTSQSWLIFFGIGLGLKGLLLLWGMYLVWVTRKVDSDFRESTYIGLSIYATFLASAIVIAVLFIVGNNPTVQFILTCLGVWIVTNAILLTLFIPKVIAIRADPTNLWETYFKRRAATLSTRQASSLSLSYQSTSDSELGSIKETVKKMSLKEKQAHLTLLTERREQVKLSLEKLDEDIAWLTADLNKTANASPKPGTKKPRLIESNSTEESEKDKKKDETPKETKPKKDRPKVTISGPTPGAEPETESSSSSEEDDDEEEDESKGSGSEPETEPSDDE